MFTHIIYKCLFLNVMSAIGGRPDTHVRSISDKSVRATYMSSSRLFGIACCHPSPGLCAIFVLLAICLANFASSNPTDTGETQTENDTLIAGENVIEAWSGWVEEARSTIHIAMYKLTSRTALKALIAARQRGVEVRLVLDGKAAADKASLAGEAASAGLDVVLWPSSLYGKLHTKLTILDRESVILGSFNLTESAEERNTEVLLYTRDKSVVKDSFSAWESLHSRAEE